MVPPQSPPEHATRPAQGGLTASSAGLPAAGGPALLRGIRGHCPRCNAGGLFSRWLKPVARCAGCGLDLTPQRADDFPAYISILLTGHLLAPVIVALVVGADLGPGALAAIILPLTLALMLALLQPAKGGVIAMQWWLGLHGFVRERVATP